jgi:hypothetical protein
LLDKYLIQETIKKNTFNQEVMSYLIEKPKFLDLNKSFLFNKLDLVNKIFQKEMDSMERRC